MTKDEQNEMDFRAEMAEYAARQRRNEKMLSVVLVAVLIVSVVLFFSLIRSVPDVSPTA